ncbi:serine protease inhibitor 27A-like [Lucilia cuprina]|uniref:serine protease inhibitor 27A-like n=1 Tax=Lucilia cuprina TaxID=7375 RepID=UPI001F058FDA|nr:serine protease inhibitor 27A-like [Lucilia cuprina]
MKYCLLYIIVTFTTLSGILSSSQTITSEEFTWKLIENSLNSTKNTENFVIAPYEAYRVYKEVYNIAEESDESDSKENETDELTTIMPAIRKQQKLLSSNQTHNADLLSSISLTARWSFNFQTRDTHKRIFHQHGKTNQKFWADFLRKDDTFYYTHDEQLNASILELPLNVKEIKLKLILPDQWDALPQLKDYLLENMDEFSELMKKTQRMTLVRVLLPKFHLSYRKDLTDFFEEISSKQVEKYENIYQLSNLEFNERGIGRFERTRIEEEVPH